MQGLPRCPVQLSSVKDSCAFDQPSTSGDQLCLQEIQQNGSIARFQLFQVGDLCFLKSFFPLCLQNTVKMMKALFWRLLTFTGLNIKGGDVNSPSLAELFLFFPLASCFRVLRSSFLELSCRTGLRRSLYLFYGSSAVATRNRGSWSESPGSVIFLNRFLSSCSSTC